MDDKKTEVYNALLKTGYTQSDIGTLDHFKSLLDVPEQRLKLYNDLQQIGYTKNDLGEFNTFETELMGKPLQKSIATSDDTMPAFSQSGMIIPRTFTTKQTKDAKQVADDPQGALIGGTKNLLKAFASGIEKTATGTINWIGQLASQDPGQMYELRYDINAKPRDNKMGKDIAKSAYEFSTASDKYLDELLPVDKKWQRNFLVGDLPNAIGSSLGFAAFGMLGGAVGSPELLTTAFAGAMVESQSMGQEAWEKSKDINKSLLASAIGVPLGATEAFGLQRYFKILGEGGKRSLGKMLTTGFKEGLEEFLQEGGQEVLENITAGSSGLNYDPERTAFGGVFRGSSAGFVSGFLMAGLGFGINHTRNRGINTPILDKAEAVVNQFVENTAREVNLNAQVSNKIFDVNNNTIEKVNQSVADQLKLQPEQINQFNSLLEQSDDGTIKDFIFKNNPQALEDKTFLPKAIFLAIKDPLEFEGTYGLYPPKELKQRYLSNVSQFLDEQGILSKQEIKNYERAKTPETAIEATPLPKKVPTAPMFNESDINYDENIWGIDLGNDTKINFQTADGIISYPKEVWVDKNIPISTEQLIRFRDEYNNAVKLAKENKETTEATHKGYDDSKRAIEVIKKYEKLFDLLYDESSYDFNEKYNLTGDKLVNEIIDSVLKDNKIIKDRNQINLFKEESYNEIVNSAIEPRGEIITPKTGKLSVSVEKVTPVAQSVKKTTIPAKELINNLEELGINDSSVAHFTKWAIEYSGNPEVRMVPSTQVLANGQVLGNRPAYYARKSSTGQHYIGINQDHTTDDSNNLYRSIAHEATHAATIQGYRENRNFRLEVNALMEDFRQSLIDDKKYNPDLHDKAFESGEEFLAYAMSNTGGFTNELRNTPIRNSKFSNFLDRLKSLIMAFYKNVLSLKDATYYRGLETILARHMGYQPQEQFTFKDELYDKPDGTFEKIEASLDKSFMITNSDMQDPRVISATAQLLGKEKGLPIKDYYNYIKTTYTYSTFRNDLLNSNDWNVRAKFFYDANYSEDMTLDEFKDKVIRNLYNLANTMDKIPVVKMVINESDYDGNVEISSSIKEFSDVYTDKNGNTKVAMHEHLKLFDLMPELGQLFNNEFQPMIVDQIETKSYKEDQYMGNRFDSIASMHDTGKNAKFSKLFGIHGYTYLGNWADKKTIVVLKGKEKVNQDIVKEIGDHYQQKVLALTDKLLRKKLGDERVDSLLKNNGNDITKVLEVLNDPLLSYIQENPTQSQIIRLVLEDLRLGGRVVDGKLVSSLFDINRPETYDALKMLKRPNLVSLTRYVHQDPIEIKSLISGLSLKNHGMTATDTGIKCSSVIINTEKIPADQEVTIDNEKYNLKTLLTNSLGTARLDGPIFYVDGGFNKVWDKLHGTVKKGVKKGWIGNSFTDDTFRNPLYIKGAFHKVPVVDPIARWMQDNNITLLIASTAAKVNTYPTTNVFGDPSKHIFQIPFGEIQRDSEKPGVKDGATGLPQMFTSNFMTKGNKSFVDRGWDRAIDDIINYNLKEFTNKVTDINYASVVEYLKDKALNGTSEQEKSVAGVVNELLMRNIDKTYNKLQNQLGLELTKEQKKIIKQQLQLLDHRMTAVSEALGNEFGNFFQEPFFNQGLKSYLGSMLSDLVNMKVPSSYLVLSPDLGIMAQSRIDIIKEHARKELINEKKKLYETMKPYIKARNNFSGSHKQFMNETDVERKALIENERNMFMRELENYEDVADQYEMELEKYFDDNGNVVFRTDEAKQAIDTQLAKFVNENGYLRDGYVMISKDVAGKYGIKHGDNGATIMIPSNNGMSSRSQIVVGILDESLLEPGAIIINSEYAQSRQGKDYDIDTTLFVPKSEAFSDQGWKGFNNTLIDTYEKHKTDILDFFRKNVNSQFNEADIYDKKAKLDLVLQDYPASEFKKGTLFNPLSQGFSILEKFNKQIGIPVNRRKINTFKSGIGLITTVKNQKLNANHKNRYRTYMLLDVLTHHMVDMPVDTGSFHYVYDEILGFDQDNGTNFYEQLKNASNPKVEFSIKSTYYGIKNFEDFLFTYAIKLNADYNLDDRQNVRNYEDGLKYISEQKDINMMLANKDYPRLLEIYRKYVNSNFNWLKSDQRSNMVTIATEYLKNMDIEDLDGSPMNRLANRTQLDILPNITTSEADYSLTQGHIINSLLSAPKFAKIKELFDSLDKLPAIQQALRNIPRSKTDINGIDTNKLLSKMFFLTFGNPQLHELKAKAISLVYPADQSTISQSQIDKLAKEPVMADNIYQKTNAETYPMLFDLLLKSRSFKFKKNVSSASIGIAKLIRGVNDQLFVEFPGKSGKVYRWTASDLLDSNTQMASLIRQHIKTELIKNPKARVNLSALLSLGGANTSLSDREQLAIDMLNNELPSYSGFEQSLFWASLLGKPDHQPKYPLNFVSPEKSSTDNYHSQKILLHILGQMKSDVANRFLNWYGQTFNTEYVGRTIKQTQTVSRLIDNDILKGDVEIFFQNPEVKPQLTEVIDPENDYKKQFMMIDNIINSVKKVDYSRDYVGSVASIANIYSGENIDLTVMDVTNALSAYFSNVPGDINHEAIAFTKAREIEAMMNMLNARENNANNLINDYIKQQKTELGWKLLNDPRKNAKITREVFTKITNLIESNELGITNIKKNRNEDYVISVGNDRYLQSQRNYTSTELNEMGFNGSINDLIKKKGKEKDRLLHQAAIEYMKRTYADNIETLENMQKYIMNTALRLSEDFGKMDIIERLADKYNGLIERFKGQGVTYYPRIVLSKDMDKIFQKLKKEEATKEINRRVEEAWKQKERGLPANEKYLVEKEAISELIDDYLQDIKSKILTNQYGDYVYTFQMKRNIDRLTNGLYIKDNPIAQDEHAKMFKKMVMTDMFMINFLEYEYNASKSGRDRKILSRMQAWTALAAQNRALMTEKVSLKKLKDGDKIQFFYDADHVQGFFRKMDDKYIYLSFDNDLYHEDILRKIKEFKQIHDSIVKNPTRPASDNQILTLKGLYQEGYAEKYPANGINNKEANDLILAALQKKMDNPDTWGRYRKDRVYIREYENGAIGNKIGVERSLAKTPNDFIKVANAITKYSQIGFRGLFLGGTPGIRTNLTDAGFMLTQDLGLPRLIQQYPKAKSYYKEFMMKLKNHEMNDYTNYLKEMKDFIENPQNQPLRAEEEKYVGAVAAKVLMEMGVTKPIGEFNIEVFGENYDFTNLSKLDEVISKTLKLAAGGATYGREYAERHIRIVAAHLYAYKAYFRDQIYDQKTIEAIVNNGVARTQALYNNLYRKLGEGTTAGKFGMQFSHYNTYMLQQRIKEHEQYVRLGKGIDIRDFMSRTTIDRRGNEHKVFPWRDSIDPTMDSKWIFDAWYNTIGRTMEIIFPGLRAGDPLGRILSIAIFTLTQIAMGKYDADDDGYDAQDLIFSIASFWLGLGYTMPAQAIYGLIFPKRARPIISVNNKVTNPVIDIYKGWIAPDATATISDEAYKFRMLEKGFIGMNAVMPAKNRYSSRKAQDIQERVLPGKLIEMIKDSPEIAIPIVNIFKYHK